MPLWLKSFNTVNTGTGITYTVPQINHYVMPIVGCNVLTAWFFAWTSDGWMRGRRWPWIAITTIFNAIICLTLVNIPLYKHIGAHFFLYYMTQVGGGMSGLLFSWATEICSRDNEERSLVIALMNNMAYVIQATVPNVTWRQVDYPKCTIGLYYSVGLSLALFGWTFLTLHLHNRDKAVALRSYDPNHPSQTAVNAADLYGTVGARSEAVHKSETSSLDKDAELAVEERK
ncbi:hypothetical protein JCM11251_000034 [Rhodosporidiobolus azoricus]